MCCCRRKEGSNIFWTPIKGQEFTCTCLIYSCEGDIINPTLKMRKMRPGKVMWLDQDRSPVRGRCGIQTQIRRRSGIPQCLCGSDAKKEPKYVEKGWEKAGLRKNKRTIRFPWVMEIQSSELCCSAEWSWFWANNGVPSGMAAPSWP